MHFQQTDLLRFRGFIVKAFGCVCLYAMLSFNLKAQSRKYQDPKQPIDVRVNDLISQLTLEEKVYQMMDKSPAIDRLGIPEYNWWNEALHGVGRSGTATVFPQAIGLAATFNDSLAYEVANAISDEARAMYSIAAKKDYHMRYGGLSFWTPNINIFRDPRWGRGQETYGEDPFLTSMMGVAFVKGLQGTDPDHLKVAACAKHYAVHSGPERVRHEFNAQASKHDLWDTYLPAFHALVNANVEAVMCAYNRTNDEPCCSNTYLLQDVLRKKWNFKGHVVSDCGALSDLYGGHKFVKNMAEAAAISVKRGVSLDCGTEFPALIDAVKQGLITEAQIDSSLAVLMRTRFKLGLFDPSGSGPYDNIPDTVINSSAHRDLARKVAQESIVLLKNNGVLPLKNDLRKYFVTGPNAANINALIGNYYGINNNFTTLIEGLANQVAKGSQLQYRPGCLLDRENINPIDWTTDAAKNVDATIVALGINGLIEGEEGDAIASASFGDRLDYNLPQNQVEFLRKIKKNNSKPVIAVISGGSPMNLAEIHDLADAVVLAWYPGEEGGNALADVLFGNVNPSGKLPVTFPMSLDQLPTYEDYSMNGRTYRYMKAEPLYPFGFGLSYTRFAYSNIKVGKPKIRKDEPQQITVTVTNTGKMTGQEVVQLYITHPDAKIEAPLYALKAFRKVQLDPGSSTTLTFNITADMLSLIDSEGNSVASPGKVLVSIGGSLPGKRSEALNAVKAATIEFIVK